MHTAALHQWLQFRPVQIRQLDKNQMQEKKCSSLCCTSSCLLSQHYFPEDDYQVLLMANILPCLKLSFFFLWYQLFCVTSAYCKLFLFVCLFFFLMNFLFSGSQLEFHWKVSYLPQQIKIKAVNID